MVTLKYELDVDITKMYMCTNNEVYRSRLLNKTDRHRQTDMTEPIITSY